MKKLHRYTSINIWYGMICGGELLVDSNGWHCIAPVWPLVLVPWYGMEYDGNLADLADLAATKQLMRKNSPELINSLPP
jgi:hypothetical protein